MSHSIKRAIRLTAVIAAAVMVLAPFAQVSVLAPQTAKALTPETNTFVTGKVLKPDGTPFSFDCMAPPPGSPPPPPGMKCGPGISLMGGPEANFGGGVDPTTGAFNIPAAAGKYRLNVNMPMEQMGGYSFTELFVDVLSGQTTNVGTITPTQKTGHIKGLVKDKGTGLGASGVQVSAFPMNNQPTEPGAGGPMMMPSFGTTDPGGNFDILVNAGHYGLNLDSRPGSTYIKSGGEPIDVTVDTDTSVVTGIIIEAIKADATITGRVLDETGAQVTLPGSIAARPVSATDFFDYNAPIMPPGAYTINVSSSVATQYSLVVHMPPGTSYSISGSLTVTVIPGGTVTQDVILAKNNSSIYGKLIADSGFALSTCKATDTTKFGGQGFGQVFANSPKTGVFVNAPIKEDCTFKLSVGAGEYQFGYNINPQAGYINRPAPPEPIVVAASQDVEKNITVVAGDAKITGQVLKPDGTPFANVFVDVGNEREINDSIKSGGQQGPGTGGQGDFKGPGNAKSPEEVMKYCGDPKNANECKNFKLPPGATGPGGCTNMLECAQYCQKNPTTCQSFDKSGNDKPGGPTGPAPMGQGAKRIKATGRSHVLAEDVTKVMKGNDIYRDNIIHSGAPTDSNGKFEILVPSGHVYEVRSNLPPDKSGSYLPPKMVLVDLKTTKSANIALQFRTSFGTMTGTVTYPNGTAASRCFVHYWSEDGGNGGVGCQPNGTFSMGYDKGKLHVGADSFDGSKGYRSDETIVVITTEKAVTQNIALKEAKFDVFEPMTKTFDAAQATTISLDNGAELTIPAGALATSGNVTITAQPNINLPSDETNNLVGTGYTFEATDASGNKITTFSSAITVKFPYSQPEIDESGLDESFLKAKYVNTSTGGFSDMEQCTQDTDANVETCSTDHFTDFAIVGASIGGKTVQVSSAQKGKNVQIAVSGVVKITIKNVKKADLNISTANFGTTAGGQLIAVSNKTKGGDVSLYTTAGKLAKKVSPFGKSYASGLQQTVEDITGLNTAKKFVLDGVSDLVVSPTNGTAQTLVYDLKQGLKVKPKSLVTGETGATGKTVLSTVQLSSGSSTLTTTFKKTGAQSYDSPIAWKLDKKKGLTRDASTGTLGKLKVSADGSVTKKAVDPKVKSTSPKSCSTSGSTNLNVKGSGFTDSVIVLWNGASALAAKNVKDTSFSVTLNSSAIDINAVNTMTIVNADGRAGVAVITCK